MAVFNFRDVILSTVVLKSFKGIGGKVLRCDHTNRDERVEREREGERERRWKSVTGLGVKN